ncbi:8-oxoguanine DNA glycosylase [Trinickia mobilis]|uniref:8-oxoguanine DNA glycosylase n=1 Tax=Trinickia mobilis TaxID=2816356 RepID=UPI001A8EC6F6|nr:hypothetical protein [Trinickia mobilis]
MQTMYAYISGETRTLTMPDASEEVLPGIPWGAFDELLTPAYWRGQVWQHQQTGGYADFRLGRSLEEEVAACLLGGWGMPAELALAAYRRVRERGLLRHDVTTQALEDALAEPFIFHGRQRKYRFSRQKARYLQGCLARLYGYTPPVDDVDFRDSLQTLPGIGLKTASWIVRNIRPTSEVAIVDVHILRAGRHIGLFPDEWEPQTHYRELERNFVSLARALGVPAATLDGLIWDYMRQLSPTLRKASPGEMRQTDLFAHEAAAIH